MTHEPVVTESEEEVFMETVSEQDPVRAQQHKERGNEAFRACAYVDALAEYTEALKYDSSSVLYSNRAAAHLKLNHWQEAHDDCASAIALDSKNAKAHLRRAEALAHMEDYHRALQDLDKCEELGVAKSDLIQRRREWELKAQKKQDEMMKQLKDLGNSILGKFGLSTDNFKFEKNSTGEGYSVKFDQNK
jgi:tetratricopeptide (TPR) repeat protein